MGILDSLSKNPTIVGLGILGIALFIFRDKISGFFSDISGGVAGAQEVGETVSILNENLQGNLTGIQDILSGKIFESIKLPTFEFPTIELPTFPDLGVLFPTFEFPDFLPNPFNSNTSPIDITETPAAIGRASDRDRIIPESDSRLLEPFRTLGDETSIIVPQGDEFGLGGGGFIGGTTTFGDNLVDSLTEVLNIFPDLTASQARDVLEENPELTSSQFRLINPDVINISNEFEQDQIFNVSSGGFTGLTPEQISKLLTGGDINNF